MRLTAAEWKVMEALWERAPATAREVLERVATDTAWAYTTVKTLLGRLVEKGALREERRGNAALYVPQLTRTNARRNAVRGLLDSAFSGSLAPFVEHLVREERLGAKERAALEAWIADEGKPSRAVRRPRKRT